MAWNHRFTAVAGGLGLFLLVPAATSANETSVPALLTASSSVMPFKTVPVVDKPEATWPGERWATEVARSPIAAAPSPPAARFNGVDAAMTVAMPGAIALPSTTVQLPLLAQEPPVSPAPETAPEPITEPLPTPADTAPPVAPETADPAAETDVWRFSFEPFVVLPVSTTGTIEVKDFSVDIDAGLSEVLSPLNLAFFGQFEGWYKNQGFVINTAYFAVGEDATADIETPLLPFPLALEGEASADLWRTDFMYAYRFGEEPADGYGEGFTEFDLPPVSFDLMGGLRFFWLSQELSINSNVGFSADRSSSEFAVEPLIRGRLRWNTSDYLAVLLDTSLSGLSLLGDSTFSVSATAGVEWLFSGNTSLTAGYQVNYLDFSANDGDTELDLLAHGPRLSFIFRF